MRVSIDHGSFGCSTIRTRISEIYPMESEQDPGEILTAGASPNNNDFPVGSLARFCDDCRGLLTVLALLTAFTSFSNTLLLQESLKGLLVLLLAGASLFVWFDLAAALLKTPDKTIPLVGF